MISPRVSVIAILTLVLLSGVSYADSLELMVAHRARALPVERLSNRYRYVYPGFRVHVDASHWPANSHATRVPVVFGGDPERYLLPASVLIDPMNPQESPAARTQLMNEVSLWEVDYHPITGMARRTERPVVAGTVLSLFELRDGPDGPALVFIVTDRGVAGWIPIEEARFDTAQYYTSRSTTRFVQDLDERERQFLAQGESEATRNGPVLHVPEAGLTLVDSYRGWVYRAVGSVFDRYFWYAAYEDRIAAGIDLHQRLVDTSSEASLSLVNRTLHPQESSRLLAAIGDMWLNRDLAVEIYDFSDPANLQKSVDVEIALPPGFESLSARWSGDAVFEITVNSHGGSSLVTFQREDQAWRWDSGTLSSRQALE